MIGSISTFRRRLLGWYDKHRRILPWRAIGTHANIREADPYAVLVSEAMLQQTTVAAVIPYFHRFMARFPRVDDLAAADEHDVLRLWQGLGYYARARNLLKAARVIVGQFSGQIPRTLEGLRSLPGVGPYTAGAVGSIALGLRCAIVDANVARVLARVLPIERDIRLADSRRLLWRTAEELVPADRPGDFNSAMMDLGATVCVPRRPCCDLCPVRRHCRAAAESRQDDLPVLPAKRRSPLYFRRVFCIHRNGRWLLEQRPRSGRWAGMWQFPTIENDGPPPKIVRGLHLTAVSELAEIAHTLSHRRYRYVAHRAVGEGKTAATSADGMPLRWLTPAQIDRYPLPGPQAKILKLLAKVPSMLHRGTLPP